MPKFYTTPNPGKPETNGFIQTFNFLSEHDTRVIKTPEGVTHFIELSLDDFSEAINDAFSKVEIDFKEEKLANGSVKIQQIDKHGHIADCIKAIALYSTLKGNKHRFLSTLLTYTVDGKPNELVRDLTKEICGMEIDVASYTDPLSDEARLWFQDHLFFIVGRNNHAVNPFRLAAFRGNVEALKVMGKFLTKDQMNAVSPVSGTTAYTQSFFATRLVHDLHDLPADFVDFSVVDDPRASQVIRQLTNHKLIHSGPLCAAVKPYLKKSLSYSAPIEAMFKHSEYSALICLKDYIKKFEEENPEVMLEDILNKLEKELGKRSQLLEREILPFVFLISNYSLASYKKSDCLDSKEEKESFEILDLNPVHKEFSDTITPRLSFDALRLALEYCSEYSSRKAYYPAVTNQLITDFWDRYEQPASSSSSSSNQSSTKCVIL